MLGESFSEIFFGNSLMIGLPCATASAADIERLMKQVESQPDVQLTLDLQAGTCTAGGFAGTCTGVNTSGAGASFTATFSV